MPMDDDQIKGLFVREIRAARAEDNSQERDDRRAAINYYNGDLSDDLPAEVGRSSVVSRDLSDAVGWILPQVLRVFTATDQIVIAEPVGQEDDDMAREATDGLNYVFYKDNPGYKLLRDATWNALVLKNGVVKVWHDDTPEYTTTFHSGLSDDDIHALEADEGTEITHQTTAQEMQPVGIDETGEVVMGPVSVHEVKVKRLKSNGRRRLDCIPTEDYLRSDDPPGTERPRFEGHRSYKTRSELIEMGFDRHTVMDLGAASDDSQEQIARNGGYSPPRNVADKSMETIEVVEGYLQADVDDDGLAETIRAYYAGNDSGGNLLDWEVWEDEGPFFLVPCEPIPHQVNGRSLADETMDIMRVKSVLWRNSLDNTYASNNPQRFVTGKIINPDELFSPTFGGAIFGENGAKVENLTIEYNADHAYEGLTYADEIVQRRTGIGRQSMALDPEALQNQTATANQNNKDAAYTQVEQIVRDMAELGWKPIFRALLKLEIKHQDKARTIRMGKRAVTIDPRSWNADMDVTINIGLGTGSRDRDMIMLTSVQQDQMLLIQGLRDAGFPDKALEILPLLHNTLTRKAESAGLRNPEAYYPDVTAEDIDAGKKRIAEMQAKGDPKVALEKEKAQADLQVQTQKTQYDWQMQQAKMQADQQSQQAKMAQDDQRMQMEFALKREQLGAELNLKREQLQAELQLKREQMIAELQLKRELGAANVTETQTTPATSEVYPGGQPG